MNVPIDVPAVRAKLIELGWTQAQLAAKAKLSERAVEGVLSRGTAALRSLQRIANALEMDESAIRRVPSSTPPPRSGVGHEPLGAARLKPPNAAEVFISYSSHDRSRVIDIANQLERLGVSCWLDRDKIPGPAITAPRSPWASRTAKLCWCAALTHPCGRGT
jgi:transcriptional regulator with XRE-family HTH domain